jgi:hypothetical protein
MTNPRRKNFRRIPPQLLRKAERLEAPNVVAACVLKVSAEEIQHGVFAHLNVSLINRNVIIPGPTLPPPNRGKFSRINSEGEEIVHRDRPKVSQGRTFEVPNFGDWSKGSHDVTIYRDVYERSFVPPPLKEISAEVIATEGTGSPVWALRFRVDEPLDKAGKDYADRFLFNLNLLQENVGAADVFPADAALADYLRSIYHTVGWELLPPGEREQTVQAIISKMRNVSQETKEKLVARYDLLVSMNPEAIVHGTGGFDRYFGAKFSDDLVVFENLEYGNAVYVMFENWEALSQLSRTELLAAFQGEFERIVHSKGWEEQLKKMVSEKLNGGT